MTYTPHLTRRQWLATTAGGLFFSGTLDLAAALTNVAETPYFFYRLAPAGPYVDSQRGSRAFGFREGKIFLSEDNGGTWPHRAEFAEAENITFSCLLKNGNILFATREKLFLSTDNLKTHRPVVVKDREGRDYLPHTPVNLAACVGTPAQTSRQSA